MSDLSKLQQTELLYAIERAEREYKSFCDTWDGIDRKSQVTTTIAGVFLGALFAFIPRFDNHADTLLVVLVLLVMGVLMVSIAASLWAMSARGSSLPPCASEFMPALISRIASGMDAEEFGQQQLAMYQEWAQGWLEANNSVDAANHSKSRPLVIGQISLLFAVGLTVVVGAIMLVSAARGDSTTVTTGQMSLNCNRYCAPPCCESGESVQPAVAPTINISNNLYSNIPASSVPSTPTPTPPSCPIHTPAPIHTPPSKLQRCPCCVR